MTDIKGVEVSDVFGVSQPLTKLIETIAGAIGKCCEPTHIRRIAKAKADEIDTISSAIARNIEIPTDYSDGKIAIDTRDFQELAKRAMGRLLSQEMRKQDNMEQVFANAAEILNKEEEISSESVNPDWTARFISSIEDISDEGMQKICGKILAGEIKRPKSFSLRTLDVLKSISQDEMVLFQKVSSLVFKNKSTTLIPSGYDVCIQHGFSFAEQLTLREAGLIGHETLALDVQRQRGTIFLAGDYIVISELKKQGVGDSLSITFEKLTRAGEDIFNVINQPSNYAFLCEFVQQLKMKHLGWNFTIHKVDSRDEEGRFHYDIQDLLQPSETPQHEEVHKRDS